MKFIHISILILILLININAQNVFSKILNEETILSNGKTIKHITYVKDFSPKAKILDLTQDIIRICDKTKTLTRNNKSITIKFSKVDFEIVNSIAEILLKVLEQTQNNLAPLKVDDLELYLLPINNINSNFTISIEKRGSTFYYLQPYTKSKDLDLDCSNGYSFGHNIFLDIPHELTHNALRDVIDAKDTNKDYPRWFEEGLAEFNSLKIASNLNPCWTDYRTSFTIPEVSLSRKEVFPALLNWGRNNKLIIDWLKYNEDPNRISWNETTLFGASYQLILNDFGKDEGTKLTSFLSILQDYKNKHKAKLQGKDLLKLYKNFVGEEFGKNTKLNSQQEQLIIQNESDFIVRDYKDNLPTENKIKRYKALSILASTSQVFDDKTLNILIEIKNILEGGNLTALDKTYLNLIDTIFGVRLSNKEFKKSIIKELNKEGNYKKREIKKILNKIISESNRPCNL